MSWLDIWWQSRCAQLKRKKAEVPADGAGWLYMLICAAKEGFVQ